MSAPINVSSLTNAISNLAGRLGWTATHTGSSATMDAFAHQEAAKVGLTADDVKSMLLSYNEATPVAGEAKK
jgi:hypothetical protein